mmetsp:Transcript_26790/g.41561  ORF Transcript_26790/g.41561 Transcript_26790/m.41561 type:complete len:672 (-) Transcript_26790:305-2320(-)
MSNYSNYSYYTQQHTVDTSQGRMAWNGKQWIPVETASSANTNLSAHQQPQPSSSSHSSYTYTQGQQQQQQSATSSSKSSSGGDEAFKANYWAKQLGNGDDYETLRQKAWAEYYRQQAANAQNTTTTSAVAPQPAPAPAPQAQPSAEQYPDGLTRYVHRSRENHATQTPEQRAWLSKHIEQVISNAIKSGKLWSFDWDSLKIPAFPPHLLTTSTTTSVGVSAGAALWEKEKAEQERKQQLKEQLKVQLKQQPLQPTQKKESYIEREKKRGRIVSDHAEENGGSGYYGPASQSADVDYSADYISIRSPKSKKPGKKQKQPKKKEKKQNQSIQHGFTMSNIALTARANRFGGSTIDHSTESSAQKDYSKYMGASVIKSANGKNQLDEADYENMTVKGTCQVLEKEYLRLTAPPKAERVRPQNILEKHLVNLQSDWLEQKRDYLRMCSQLKAIRQDLTVQRINNSFTVKVYETHARLALESADLNEYNQCQTQLKYLYDLVKEQGYDKYDALSALKNEHEFIAYRLLYYIFLTTNKKYEGGSSDLNKILLNLTKKEKADPGIVHGTKVREAIADFNYHIFFQLQETAPLMGSYLMDYLVPFVRYGGLQRICKAYRPHVCKKFVLTELGFRESEFEEGERWLLSCGCVLNDDLSFVLTKDCVLHPSTMEQQPNSLI